ncbi:MAG: alpha/beta fold hydrolase [Puniceicoccaceae bacterium]
MIYGKWNRIGCVLAVGTMLFSGSVGLSKEQSEAEQAAGIYFKNPQFSRFQMSPDGSHLSMIAHRDRQDVLATYNVETKRTRVAKGSPGQSISQYAWIDGNHLIFSVRLWDSFYIGMYSAFEDMSRMHALGEQGYDSTMNMNYSKQFLWLEDSLRNVPRIALLQDMTRNRGFPELVYYDVVSHGLTGRIRNKNKAVDWLCGPDGVVRIEERLAGPGKRKNFYRPDKTAEWTELELPKGANILDMDRSGKKLFLSLGRQGRRSFQIWDIEQGKLTGKPVNHPEFSCSPLLLRDRGTDAMIGVRYNWDKPKIVYFNPAYKEFHKALQTKFPGTTIRILGSTAKGAVLFSITSDIIPTKILSYDPSAENPIELLLNQYPAITTEHTGPMSPITFESRDGAKIHGYLTRSHKQPEKQGPTVMLIHGGPKSRDDWDYNPQVQFLAHLGYHVIQVNYRGSSGFNRDYSINKLQDICSKAVEDTTDAARWAIAEGIADPDRIAILGGSFGGYTALASAAFEPDLYKVAIGVSGVYNFDEQLKEDFRGESGAREWYVPMFGDIKENPDLYRELSPIHYAGDIKAQVLLFHGGADSNVAASQSKRMSRALKAAGKPHEVEINTWGVHGFYNQKERIKYGTLLGEFLKKHL